MVYTVGNYTTEDYSTFTTSYYQTVCTCPEPNGNDDFWSTYSSSLADKLRCNCPYRKVTETLSASDFLQLNDKRRFDGYQREPLLACELTCDRILDHPTLDRDSHFGRTYYRTLAEVKALAKVCKVKPSCKSPSKSDWVAAVNSYLNEYGCETKNLLPLKRPSPNHRLTTSLKATILKEQTKTQTKETKIMPKLDSVPAVNREGFSRVTFWGLEDGCKEYDVTDKETGEITKAKREYTKLKFTILDKTKVSPLTANVVGQSLNTRELWATVLGLGYKPEETPDTLDDGDDTLDDEPVETANELDAIVNFLKCVEGKHFICKVERDKRGYWTLKPETLAPFVPVAK